MNTASVFQKLRHFLLFWAFSPWLFASNFNEADRWVATATDGTVASIGTPITLTWSIVPDGLVLGTAFVDPVVNPNRFSNLIANFDDKYNVPAVDRIPDLTLRPWFAEMQTVFNIYASKIGVTYVYVADDGAPLSSPAVLGLRGDVRIGGTELNGPFAYNGLPGPAGGGDMVINTAKTEFADANTLRLIFGHEHAHGLGLGHVTVNGSQSLSVVAGRGGNGNGAQLDDLSALLRAYGDIREKGLGDDTLVNSRPLGNLPSSSRITLGNDATDVSVLAADLDFAHSSGSGDADFFRFSIAAPRRVVMKLIPQGPTYDFLPEGATATTTINLTNQADLVLRLQNAAGATLATSDLVGTGLTETITYDLPTAGDYHLRVTNKTNKGQFYRLDIGSELALDTTNRYAAEFDALGNFEGWNFVLNQLTSPSVSGDFLNCQTTGVDAFIATKNLNLSAAAAPHIIVRVRTSGGGNLQLYWGTTLANSFVGARAITIPHTGNGNFQTFIINTAANANWSGTISQLRFDWPALAGLNCALDYVRSSDGDYDDDGIPDLTEGTLDTDGDGLSDYEDLDSDADALPDAWEAANSLNPKLATDAGLDADGDGSSNLAEYLAGTAPRNAAERFSATLSPSSNHQVQLPGKLGRIYALQRSTTLQAGSWTEISRTAALTSDQALTLTDPAPPAGNKAFYRVVVTLP